MVRELKSARDELQETLAELTKENDAMKKSQASKQSSIVLEVAADLQKLAAAVGTVSVYSNYPEFVKGSNH